MFHYKKLNSCFSRLFVIIGLGFLNLLGVVSAQDFYVDITGGTGVQTSYVRHAEAFSPDVQSFTVQMLNFSGETFRWIVENPSTPGTDYVDLFSGSDVTTDNPNLGGLDARILIGNSIGIEIPTPDAIPPGGATTADIEFELGIGTNFVGGNPTQFRTISVQFILRRPLEFVFVLDKSGSMAWEATSSATGPSRWEALQQGVESYLGKIDDNLQLSSDQYGIVYFSNDATATVPDSPPGSGLSGFNMDELTSFESGGVAVTPGGGTSIAAGIQEAVTNRLTSTADRRRVLLTFTDGEQTVAPFVDYSGTQLGIGTSIDFTSGTPAIRFVGISGAKDSDLYLASVVTTPAATSIFSEMSSNHIPASLSSGGTVEIISDAMFNNIFSQYSPNKIQKERYIISNFGSSTIEVNKGVSSLMFDLYFDRAVAQNYSYQVYKVIGTDTVNVSSFLTRKSIGTLYASSAINFSLLTEADTLDNGDRLTSEGTWILAYGDANSMLNPSFNGFKATKDSLKLNPASFPSNQYKALQSSPLKTPLAKLLNAILSGSATGADFAVLPDTFPKVSVIATADDHNIDFDTGLEESETIVNGTLTPFISLRANGSLVAGADAEAIILKPGDDLGDILAREEVPGLDPTDPDFQGFGTEKIRELLENDPEALEEWLSQFGQRLPLVLGDDEVYRPLVSYTDTDVRGIYQVVYFIEVDHPDLGIIRRTKVQPVFLEVLEFDYLDEETDVQYVQAANGLQGVLTIRPGYRRNGKLTYLGPGETPLLTLSGPQIAVSSEEDLGDGSYRFTFDILDGQENPDITLNHYDDPVAVGALDDLVESGKWSLSGHYLATFPFSDMANTYGQGTGFEGDISYRFRPNWMVELIVGNYQFDSAFSSNGGALLLNGNLTPNAGNFSTWLGLGPGVQIPQGGSAVVSANGRLSLRYRISPALSISGNGAITYTNSPDLRFATAGIGVHLHL